MQPAPREDGRDNVVRVDCKRIEIHNIHLRDYDIDPSDQDGMRLCEGKSEEVC